MTAGRPAERLRQPPADQPVSVPAFAWMRSGSPAAPAPGSGSPQPSRRLPGREGRATATRPAVGGALPGAYSTPSGPRRAWWRSLRLAGGGVHGGCDRHLEGCPYHPSITNPAQSEYLASIPVPRKKVRRSAAESPPSRLSRTARSGRRERSVTVHMQRPWRCCHSQLSSSCRYGSWPRRPRWPSPGDADSDFTAGSFCGAQTASGIANAGAVGSSASTSTKKVPDPHGGIGRSR